MDNALVSQDIFNFTIYVVCGVDVGKIYLLCHCEAHLVRRGNLIARCCPILCGAAVGGASKRSKCPATVALRLITRQPKTRLRLRQFVCLMLHFAKRHNIWV